MTPAEDRSRLRALDPKTAVLVFDVNQTLLATGPLRPRFEHIFGDGSYLHRWFEQILLYSQTATLTGTYVDFGALARLSLEALAEASGVHLRETDREEVLEEMKRLPAHEDVPPAFEQFAAAGFRMAAFSNSPPDTLRAQLEHAGIAHYFEQVLSVHGLEKYKPAPATYQYAAQQLAIPLGSLVMVAAHAWDVIGALQAGCQAAFVQRPGHAWFHLRKPPELFVKNLVELSEHLVK